VAFSCTGSFVAPCWVVARFLHRPGLIHGAALFVCAPLLHPLPLLGTRGMRLAAFGLGCGLNRLRFFRGALSLMYAVDWL